MLSAFRLPSTHTTKFQFQHQYTHAHTRTHTQTHAQETNLQLVLELEVVSCFVDDVCHETTSVVDLANADGVRLLGALLSQGANVCWLQLVCALLAIQDDGVGQGKVVADRLLEGEARALERHHGRKHTYKSKHNSVREVNTKLERARRGARE